MSMTEIRLAGSFTGVEARICPLARAMQNLQHSLPRTTLSVPPRSTLEAGIPEHRKSLDYQYRKTSSSSWQSSHST